MVSTLRRGDEEALVKNANDKSIHRGTLVVPYPYTRKDARDWIKKNLREAKRKSPAMVNFAIDVNGEVVGMISLSKIVPKHKAELGYWLGKKCRGKGIMTNAVKEVTRFGFTKLELHRIYADVFPFNKGSMRVLEKAGFKFEGVLKKNSIKDGKFIDSHRFAKVL